MLGWKPREQGTTGGVLCVRVWLWVCSERIRCQLNWGGGVGVREDTYCQAVILILNLSFWFLHVLSFRHLVEMILLLMSLFCKKLIPKHRLMGNVTANRYPIEGLIGARH